MTYDEYKLAAPPTDVCCEACGEYGDWQVFTPDNMRYGYVLCPECYAEMEQEQRDEREYAFQQMLNE